MSALAHWLSRQLWWAMLWLMRRPWMKRLQRAAIGWMPEARRERAWANMKRQNTFALKHGRRVLTFALTILLASILITSVYFLLLRLQSMGALTVPD